MTAILLILFFILIVVVIGKYKTRRKKIRGRKERFEFELDDHEKKLGL